MANVGTVSPLPGSASMSRRIYSDQRPPSQGGSRPSSRVGFQVSESPRPHSRQGSGGHVPHPPSRSPDRTASPVHERPPSVRSLREKTEMADFLTPMVKSAVRRWKRFHEQRVRERYLQRKSEKKLQVDMVREEKQRLARRIPVDTLALEWLNDNRVTVDARAYLLDKLLPTLILGIEKLLIEAENRGLAESNEADPNFNPINFLGQYLMRNNPRYSNFPEASPYIRGLREVTEELKKHVFSFEDNRLAKIKADARRRREEQERQSIMRTQERQQRSARLRQNYQEWLIDDDGMIELQVLQTAVQSFADVIEGIHGDVKKASQLSELFVKDKASTERVGADDFVKYLKKYIANMTPTLFNELLGHLQGCATAYRRAAILEARREILTRLFNTCDHAGVGTIDRHRVRGLFENFWDNSQWTIKRYLHNPRKWPVVELDEVADELDSISEDSMARSLPGTPAAGSTTKGLDRKPANIEEKKLELRLMDEVPAEVTTEDVISATGEKLNIGGASEEVIDALEKAVAEQNVAEQLPSEIKVEGKEPTEPVEAVEPVKETLKEAKPKEEEVKAVDQIAEPSADQEKDQTAEVKEGSVEQVVETEAVVAVVEPSAEPVEDPSAEPVEDPSAKPFAELSSKPVEEPAVEAAEQGAEPALEPTGPVEEPSAEQVTYQEPIEPAPSTAVSESVGAESTGAVPVPVETEPTKAEEQKADKPLETIKPEASAGEKEAVAETVVETSPESEKQSVTFHRDTEETTAKTDHSSIKSPTKTPTSHRCGSVATSIFDENLLNSSQFVQIVEAFLGESPPEEVVGQLLKYLEEGYIETEEEKYLRLQKSRREAQSAKQKLMLEQLFEKWDNDGSGYLDLEELHSVMSKFKENMEAKIMQKAKTIMMKEEYDNRLSKREFRAYIEAVCSMLPGGEDNFDPLIEFLMTSIERSYEERIRGQARKKWLNMIISSAETSGASLHPVYKCVFNSLFKDAEQHGRGKRISANIAMLERNDSNPARGPTCLRYVASTPDDAHFMLNKILYRDMKGISFTSVDTGKPIHVPRVQNHGNIMFWNPDRSEEDRQGSFIVIPLKDHRKRVFGVLGVDTLNDPQEKSIFITHEISFFQGVAKAFSSAHQYVDIRKKTLRITESALAWIHRRSPHVLEINVYIVEPDEKEVNAAIRRRMPSKNKRIQGYLNEEATKQVDDIVLRRMMTTDRNGNITMHEQPTKLERKENLFRDYLFKCVDNSDTVTADAYGQRHIAFPLRDPDGRAVALIDLSIGELKQLAGHENKEVQRMLKLLQAAHKEVSMEYEGGDRTYVLEAEKASEESRIDIMFDRIMLTDLRENVGKLNTRAFAELKSYKDPPKVIHDILVSVLTLFYQDKSDEGELESWNTCKQFVNQELIRKIEEFDPTASDTISAVSKISSRLKDVPHGAVAKHGSLPAQNLYNWAFVCLSLLEHTSKMQKTHKPSIITPPASAENYDGGALEM